VGFWHYLKGKRTQKTSAIIFSLWHSKPDLAYFLPWNTKEDILNNAGHQTLLVIIDFL